MDGNDTTTRRCRGVEFAGGDLPGGRGSTGPSGESCHLRSARRPKIWPGGPSGGLGGPVGSGAGRRHQPGCGGVAGQ